MSKRSLLGYIIWCVKHYKKRAKIFYLENRNTEERWEQLMEMSPLHKLNHHTCYQQDGKNFYSHIIFGIPEKVSIFAVPKKKEV